MGERRTDAPAGGTRFLVMFRSEGGERLARVAIESLRAFGGPLRDCPVWAFVLDPDRVAYALPDLEGVHCLPLVVKGENGRYPLAQKVYGCAQAEAIAGPEVRSLVWLSLDCLVINPPVLFDLGAAPGAPAADAAFRPVHHQNVGSPADQAPDGFWQGIYARLEVDEMPYTVESFADGKTLRPYFNTHCFAFDPATGLARAWWEGFKTMVRDEAFQAGPCRDEPHQIFLHQAVLSTLVAKLLPWERVRLLPPEYNYPLNLLHEIPPERRATTLNNLVNAVYEDAFPWGEIEIQEPLRSWLREHMPGGEGG
jgi:hypothetical protein